MLYSRDKNAQKGWRLFPNGWGQAPEIGWGQAPPVRLLLFFFLIISVNCLAQNRPIYSQYMFNGLTTNPAYAGSNEALNVVALYRNSQWDNSLVGAPVTQSFSCDFPLINPQFAVGLTVFDDKINIFRQSGAFFAYSYRINKFKGKLSFGAHAGFEMFNEELSKINTAVKPDPLFIYDINNNIMPNIGLGTYYYRSNIFAGISIPQLLEYSSKTDNSHKVIKPALTNTTLYFGVFVPTGIDLKLRPTALVQFSSREVLYDLNCNFIFFKEIFELGVSWRSSNVLVGMALIRIAPLTIGYAYDYGIDKPEVINTSHEIMLRFDLIRKKVIAASPLYLIR